jgi:hypothetical protein
MARISTYAIDNNVTSQDKWIGTDSNGSITKNFTPQGIADWINSVNAVGIAGQINFRFQSDITSGRSSGTISFDAGGGDDTAFSAITTIKASRYNSGTVLIIDFLKVLNSKYILLCQVDDANKFGIYKVTSIVQDIDEPNFYDIGLDLITSNGGLIQDEYYAVVAWPEGVNDKHYMHNQVVASSSWEITHNLGKHPSVSIVDSGGNWVIGDIAYTNENTLTINFTAAFSGKAYLN